MPSRLHRLLVAQAATSHKRVMIGPLFDQEALALRRKRALALGPDLFLHDRAIGDVRERLGIIRRTFHSLLIVSWPRKTWAARLADIAPKNTAVDQEEELVALPVGAFDLCIALGTIDTFNDLPMSLAILRHAITDGGLLIGAIAGGNSLPLLRSAMRAADIVSGEAVPHVHPRIDASGLTGLLANAGFRDVVVDIDRIALTYGSLQALTNDLRRMAATNVLAGRARTFLPRAAVAAASRHFASDGGGSAVESIELLHFAAWAPQQKQS